MDGETCNIFGRRINRKTGELSSTRSLLHSDLLDLTKECESIKESRKAANEMLLLSLTHDFSETYYDQLYVGVEGLTYLELIEKNREIEPTLWNLMAVILDREPSGTVELENEINNILDTIERPAPIDVINHFNRKLLSQCSYDSLEEAMAKIKELVPKLPANNVYMLTIAYTNNGKFALKAVPNTAQNQLELLNNIYAYENVATLIDVLRKQGVDVEIVEALSDLLMKEAPKDLEHIIEGFEGIIEVPTRMFNDNIEIYEGKFSALNPMLAYKVGLLIVKAINNYDTSQPDAKAKKSLLLRLKNIVNNEVSKSGKKWRRGDEATPFIQDIMSLNPELWEELNLGNGADIDAVVAFILGNYLENVEAVEKYFAENDSIGRFCKRILEWFRTFFIERGRSIKSTTRKVKAEVAALTLVKRFLKDTSKIDTTKIISKRGNVREDTRLLFDTLTLSLLDLDVALQQLKNFNYKAYTTFNKQFKDRITNMHEILHDIEGGIETAGLGDVKAQIEMLNELASMCTFLGETFNSCKESLAQVCRGIDKDGNPIDYKEGGEIIRYAETVLEVAKKLRLNYPIIMAKVDGSISYTADNGFEYSLQDYKNAFKATYDKMNRITTSLIIFDKGDTPANLQDALRMARLKVATDLLVEINGGNYLAISLYVATKNLFNVTRKDSTVYNVKELLETTLDGEDSVDCCPSGQWFSRWVNSMADNPDIVNKMIHDKVAQQKHAANIKTLNMMERLRTLYNAIPTGPMGTRNTARFMERDENGKLTGNILSLRNFGKWEKAFNEFRNDFKDYYYRVHKDEYKSIDEMLADKHFLMEYGKACEQWHQYNSKKVVAINVKDGTPQTYDDGSFKEMYVPLIGEDLAERERLLQEAGWDTLGIATYDNPEYEKLTKEDKEWLREYLIIKQELDDLLPLGSTPLGGIRVPLFRGTLTKRIGNLRRLGTARVGLIAVKWCKMLMMTYMGENPFETEFGGEHNTYDSDLYDADGKIVFSRAHSNLLLTIPQLPMYGVRKIPDMDELSTDLCSSLLAYASMAYNYDCLNQVVAALEVTKDAVAERKSKNGATISQIRRSDTQESMTYHRLEDYITLQVYNIYTDANQSKFNRAARKLFSAMARAGSTWYLGWNLHGGVVNVMTGLYQIIRRSLKNREDFTFGSFCRAMTLYFFGGSRFRGTFERGKNLLSPGSDYTDTHDHLHLFKMRYNISNHNQSKFREWNIGTTGFTMSFGQNISNLYHLCYSFFEDFMSTIPYMVTAMDTKLVERNPDGSHGEVISLWDALRKSIVTKTEEVNGKKRTYRDYDFSYDKYDIIDKNAVEVWNTLHKDTKRAAKLREEDEWKMEEQTYTRVNRHNDNNNKHYRTGHGVTKYIPFDEQQDSRFRNRAQMTTNYMHGIYNTQDAGALMKFAATGAFLSLRKYSIGLITERFAQATYDMRTRDVHLGDYVTLWALTLIELFYHGKWEAEDKGITGGKEAGMRLMYFLQGLAVLSTLPILMIFNTYGDRWENLGLSKTQVSNINGVIADLALAFFMKVLISFWAPPLKITIPDDDDDEEAELKRKQLKEEYSYTKRLARAVVNSVDLFGWNPFADKLHPYGTGEDYYIIGEDPHNSYWEEKFADMMLSFHIWTEKILPIEKSINDPEIVNKEYMKKTMLKEYGVLPYSISAMAYYTTFRNYIEIIAYNPLKPAAIYTEFRNVLASSIPGTAAIMDIVALGIEAVSENFFPVTLEEIDQMSKLKAKGYDNGKKIFTRGFKYGYYKWYKHLEATALNPARSWSTTYKSGYEAEKNFKYFLTRESPTLINLMYK